MKDPIMTQLAFLLVFEGKNTCVSPCDHLALLSLWMSALLYVGEGIYSPETTALIKEMRKSFSPLPSRTSFVPFVVGGANTPFLCNLRLSLVKPDQNERWRGRTCDKGMRMMAWPWYDESFWKMIWQTWFVMYIFLACSVWLYKCLFCPVGTIFSLFMEIKCRFKDRTLFMLSWLHSFQRHLSLSKLFFIRCWIDSVNSAKAAKSSGVCPWQTEAIFRGDCLTWNVSRLHDLFMC